MIENGIHGNLYNKENFSEMNPKIELMRTTLWSQHLEIDELRKELWAMKGNFN